MNNKKVVAVILAAGVGKRMNSDIPKQYLKINDKEILYYTIRAFEKSKIDEMIIVTGNEEIDYCKNQIVDKYKFTKVSKVVAGGKERYNSVANGLNAIDNADYVLIHDGARPCISSECINEIIDCVKENSACIMAVNAKDTIKVVEDGFIVDSPNRAKMWQAQTPQGFDYKKIKTAYNKLINESLYEGNYITDDASVWSLCNEQGVKVYIGDYKNIKITTPEDIEIARKYLL